MQPADRGLVAARAALSRLEGRQQALARQEADLVAQVGEAKARLLLKDEVTELLDLLQRKAHERDVGVYQRLLTAILRDVFPGNSSEVKLQLRTERGVPALDIELERDGNREDVLDGNGGALTNVISTGLRYIVLNQLRSHRKFVLLDEPDCWISPDNVPQFVGVMANLAQETGTQTLLITHHDVSQFPADASVVRLSLNGDIPVATPDTQMPAWRPDQKGIRYIRLINARRHHDTLIPLAPGVTVLAGPNNAGKSVVGAALTALAVGESSDTLIRHHTPKCQVIVGLEGDRRLEFTRARKGVPKTLYALFEGSEPTPVHEEPGGRGAVPSWATESLGVQRANDLEVQLGNQKAPIFLLDEKSPSARASLLSVGKEASHLHGIMDDYQGMVRQDRETTARGEKEVAAVRKSLAALLSLPELGARLIALEQAQDRLREEAQALQALGQAAAAVEGARAFLARKQQVATILGKLPALPPLADVGQLGSLLGRLSAAKTLAAQKGRFHVPVLPVLQDVEALASLLRNLETQQNRAQGAAALSQLKLPDVPQAQDTRSLAAWLAAHGQAKAKANASQFELGMLKEELADVESSWGVCPTCNSLVQGAQHAH